MGGSPTRKRSRPWPRRSRSRSGTWSARRANTPRRSPKSRTVSPRAAAAGRGEPGSHSCPEPGPEVDPLVILRGGGICAEEGLAVRAALDRLWTAVDGEVEASQAEAEGHASARDEGGHEPREAVAAAVGADTWAELAEKGGGVGLLGGGRYGDCDEGGFGADTGGGESMQVDNEQGGGGGGAPRAQLAGRPVVMAATEVPQQR